MTEITKNILNASLFLLILMLCLPQLSLATDATNGMFSWPIGCVPGVSCVGQHFRIGYPDVGNNGKSYACGKPGYFGHQGTDIIVSSVELGVSVMAAANGFVRWVQDGLYDHCPNTTQHDCEPQTRSILPLGNRTDASLGFNAGNFIVIEHTIKDVKYLTLYAHLRTGSQKVVPGQRVGNGDKIAEVGSSGNSRLPHLHFGILKEEGMFYRLVDPWRGPCNASSDGLWISDPPYQSDDQAEETDSSQTWPTEQQ